MKKVLLMVCLIASTMIVKAQEEVSFNDEELTKYATVMVWAELEKGKMTGIYNEWINNDETLVASRFVEIKKTKGDSLKLQEIAVTNDEVVAFEMIQANYDSMINSFTDVYKAELKEKVSYGLYNKLRKALKADADLKTRYQTIYDGLLEEQKSSGSDESDE
ncbi:hypothetical protein [Ekhidna sp.]